MSYTFQKLESAAITIALLAVYYELGFSWIWFAALILSPDIFMIGYLKDAKIGAMIYNIGHSYFSPIALWFFSHHLESDFWIAFAIIWTVHIAADRLLGFGLKAATGFKDTHLGRL